MLRSITKPKPVNNELEQKHLSDCLAFIAGRIPAGISINISCTGVRASMGSQEFALNQNRYELQADVEALCRLNERRVS